MRKNSRSIPIRNPARWLVALALAGLMAGQGEFCCAQERELLQDKDKPKSNVQDSIDWGFAAPVDMAPPAVDLIEKGGVRLPETAPPEAAPKQPSGEDESESKPDPK